MQPKDKKERNSVLAKQVYEKYYILFELINIYVNPYVTKVRLNQSYNLYKIIQCINT